jgi:hypothetical protein
MHVKAYQCGGVSEIRRALKILCATKVQMMTMSN